MKRILVLLAKVSISVAILAYLVWDALGRGESAFADEHGGFRWQAFEAVLAHAAAHAWLLLVALVACFGAVALTLIRWHYLVGALGLPFSVREAFRLGFLGYLFNLAPMGIVGGDLLKAVMLARLHPGHRPEAVATVVVDRIIGLHTLFVVASVAIVCTGFGQVSNATIRVVCAATIWATILGTVVLGLLWLPDSWLRDVAAQRLAFLARVPYLGPATIRLVSAMGLYRHQLPVVFGSAGMSVGVHSLFTVGVFLIGWSLYGRVHPLELQFVMSPLSAATGVLPIPVGPFEFVLDRLYVSVPLPDGAWMAAGQGLVVALAYRVITLMIAAIGICYYLASRAELADVLHEAESTSADNGQAQPCARAAPNASEELPV